MLTLPKRTHCPPWFLFQLAVSRVETAFPRRKKENTLHIHTSFQIWLQIGKSMTDWCKSDSFSLFCLLLTNMLLYFLQWALIGATTLSGNMACKGEELTFLSGFADTFLSITASSSCIGRSGQNHHLSCSCYFPCQIDGNIPWNFLWDSVHWYSSPFCPNSRAKTAPSELGELT